MSISKKPILSVRLLNNARSCWRHRWVHRLFISHYIPQLICLGSSYISSHSADVILSDIRPTKLKPDALRAINILLDEFLYKLLSISGTLATDKLRASLLILLPTSLGKEALLEAEVELRAYWERKESRVPVEDDSRTFHLQWAFEVCFITFGVCLA